MKVNFYLDRRKGKSERLPIFLHYWHEGSLLRAFTGEHCDSKNWNGKTQRVKKRTEEADEINMILDSMRHEMVQYVRLEKRFKRHFTIADLKENMSFLNGNGKDFFQVWDEFVYEHVQSGAWKESTAKRLWVVKNHLLSSDKPENISFESINSSFLKEFSDMQKRKGLSNSYINQNIELLKWFLNWAGNKGYMRNMDYKKFKADLPVDQGSKRPQIFLDEKELNRMYSLKPGEKSAELVKDSFCFACLTGMTYGDMAILAYDQLREDRLFYAPLKSSRGVVLELTGIIKEIIEKYRSSTSALIFPLPRIQNYNKILKDLGKAAGIVKYELLSSQASRKTFFTLAVKSRVSLEVMAEMTGVLPATLSKHFTVDEHMIKTEIQKLSNIVAN